MKNQTSRILFFVLIALSTFLTSCEKKDETTPGSDDRDVFVGDWVTTESSKHFGSTSFTISVSKSTTDNSNVIIKNFYNLGSSSNTIASVSGSTITISSQQVSAQTLSGSGSFGSNKINWTYTTSDATQKDTCTAVSSK